MESVRFLPVLLGLIFAFGFAYAQIPEGTIHQNDYYVVSFDGEGDAVVSAKMIIDNTTDNTIRKISLEIPGRATIYKAVQEYQNYSNRYYDERSPNYKSPTKIDVSYEHTSEATIVTLNLPTP